jgi:small-conductance mechanosensitive channel
MISFRSRILAITLKALFTLLLLWLLTIRYLLYEYLQVYYSVTITTVKFVAFIIALDILNDLLKYFYRKRVGLASAQHDNITLGLNNIYLLLVLGSSVVTITAYFGLNPKELFTSLSIVAAALAIITRDYIVDIASGMFIAFSKDVVIEDYIRIGEHSGKIVDIGINKIALLNDDDDIVFIPNHKFIMNEIINYSRRTVRRTILDLELDLRKSLGIEALEAEVQKSLQPFSEYIVPKTLVFKILRIHKEHMLIKLQYDLSVSDRTIEKAIRRAVLRHLARIIRDSPSGAGSADTI